MGAVVEDDVDLHAPSHALFYLVLAIGFAAVGASIYFLNAYSNRQDAAVLQHFDVFRSTYAEKCGLPDFAGPAPEMLRKQYLSSPTIQAAVDKQLVALQAGAGCFEVADALRKVDLAIPRPH
jgi:hypothetical protein